MIEVWPTVVWPLLDALRPAITLDVGADGGRLASRVAKCTSSWDGSVVTELNGACAEMALLHGDPNWWTASNALGSLALHCTRGASPLPITLVHNAGPPWGRRDLYPALDSVPEDARQPCRGDSSGWIAVDAATPRNGVAAAIADFVAGHRDLEVIMVPGLGGTAVLVDPQALERAPSRLADALAELRFPQAALAHLAAVDEDRLQAWDRVAGPRSRLVDHRTDAIGDVPPRRPGTAGSSSLARLALVDASPPKASGGDAGEPSAEGIRELLAPERLLDALGWVDGDSDELALPTPCDLRGVLDARRGRPVAILAGEDELALRVSLCSVLDRSDGPVALGVYCPEVPGRPVARFLERATAALPGLQVLIGVRPPDDIPTVVAGEQVPWRWLEPAESPVAGPSVAYLLPGLPRGGSGGSHSVVQEARGLRQLGAAARVCVPAEALAEATRTYGDEDLFVAYQRDEAIVDAVGDAQVVVATEHTSIGLLARCRERRPDVVCAYYVQDYETLFAPSASRRSDRALLSYRAVPGQLMFAKTDWLRNVVQARRSVFVAKVAPSLDGGIFHATGRVGRPPSPLRVTAMVRPRTPRRRPRATVAALRQLVDELGSGVEVHTFGCTAQELATAAGSGAAPGRHHGVLSRAQVADLLRTCDVFLDGSAYQAFGRTGLEAMACGAVPVLPALGGVREYAVDRQNALIAQGDDPHHLAGIIAALARDPARVLRLRAAGLATASAYSVERTAVDLLEMFGAAVARRHRAGSLSYSLG